MFPGDLTAGGGLPTLRLVVGHDYGPGERGRRRRGRGGGREEGLKRQGLLVRISDEENTGERKRFKGASQAESGRTGITYLAYQRGYDRVVGIREEE